MTHTCNLYSMLKENAGSNMYPFHMPGHKRNLSKLPEINPYSIDITEIDGFDDLHHATGCIKAAEERAARIFCSDMTYFLVNGCTVGILAAISACSQNGDSILMARNSHKSVYNAVFINRLKPIYLWPDNVITPESVKEALEVNEGVACIVVTSPTYDGTVSDIKEIAEVAHSYGIPLIVDEAHGAHMAFHNIFPESAVSCGADIVIHGIHKTLPSFTQTALLHRMGTRVDVVALEKYLSIYQSSSPSYILMGAIDYCMEYLDSDAKEDYEEYAIRLRELYSELSDLKNIYILPYSDMRDASKIVICTDRTDINGMMCYNILRDSYKLQPEMAEADYVIMMTSVFDTDEGFTRLIKALKGIDDAVTSRYESKKTVAINDNMTIYNMSPYDAYISEGETVPLMLAEGRVSKEMVYIYPPGVPIIVPGERITNDCIKLLENYEEKGFELKGMSDIKSKSIIVIIE